MKGYLVLFFILLVFAGIIGYVYYTIEKDSIEEPPFVDFTITTVYDKQRISTGYVIELDGIISKKGQTLTGGSIIEKLPTNRSIKVYNENLPGQDYYTTVVERDSFDTETKRVNIELEKAGELDISHAGSLGDDELEVIINSRKEFRNLHFCVGWSSHIIYSRPDFNKSEQLPGYDACYNTQMSLNGNFTKFELEMKYLGTLDSSDNLEFIFYDMDYFDGELTRENIGGPDIKYFIY